MRFALLTIFLLLVTTALQAQSYDRMPKDSIHFPEDKDWLVTHRRFWCRVDTGWKMARIPYVRNAREWEGHYYVSTGDMKALVDRQGRVLYGASHWIRKFDEVLLGYVCGRGTYMMTLEGDTLAFAPGGENKKLRGTNSMVNGQGAICLAFYETGLRGIRKDNIKAWGMIDGKGNWLIPPDYDAPFEFKEGKAKVLQKGKEFWIDELGEPIEAPALPDEVGD